MNETIPATRQEQLTDSQQYSSECAHAINIAWRSWALLVIPCTSCSLTSNGYQSRIPIKTRQSIPEPEHFIPSLYSSLNLIQRNFAQEQIRHSPYPTPLEVVVHNVINTTSMLHMFAFDSLQLSNISSRFLRQGPLPAEFCEGMEEVAL